MHKMMIIKKSLVLMVCIMLLGAFLLSGCGTDEVSDGFKLYYIKSDKTGLYPVMYQMLNTDTDSCVYEVLKALSEDQDKVEYMKTISTDIQVTDFYISGGNLYLYFNRAYSDMEVLKEVLVRAALVRTLTQIEGVDSVSIYVSGKPLEEADGTTVGPMTAASFVGDFSKEALLSTKLVLYYATFDGKYLSAESRDVFYTSNSTLEHIVVDQLMSGTDNSNLLTTMPADLRMLSINTTGGVCYVNFNESFLNSVPDVTNNVVVYSIVNSLTELQNVESVVITVNGSVPVFATEGLDLSKPLSRNDSIISKASAQIESAPTSGVVDVLHGSNNGSASGAANGTVNGATPQ